MKKIKSLFGVITVAALFTFSNPVMAGCTCADLNGDGVYSPDECICT